MNYLHLGISIGKYLLLWYLDLTECKELGLAEMSETFRLRE